MNAPELAACLCHRVYRKAFAHRPTWRQSPTTGLYMLICEHCKFHTEPDHNKQSVIYAWESANRIGDKHYQDNWIKVHTRQLDEIKSRKQARESQKK